MKKEIKVGLLGFGTVGTGVVRMIQEHQEDLFHQTGCVRFKSRKSWLKIWKKNAPYLLLKRC